MAGASRAPRMIPIRPRGWPRWAQGRAHAIQLLVHALFAVGVLAVLFGGAAAARVHVAYAYDGGIEQSAATSVNLGLRTAENACQTQRASQSAGASASVVAAEDGGAVLNFGSKAAARQGLEGDAGTAANRFFRDATSKSQDFQAQELSGGGYRVQFFSPANNPGYGKLYVQEIDSAGNVISEFKNTIGPDGLIETKWVHGGP